MHSCKLHRLHCARRRAMAGLHGDGRAAVAFDARRGRVHAVHAPGRRIPSARCGAAWLLSALVRNDATAACYSA